MQLESSWKARFFVFPAVGNFARRKGGLNGSVAVRVRLLSPEKSSLDLPTWWPRGILTRAVPNCGEGVKAG